MSHNLSSQVIEFYIASIDTNIDRRTMVKHRHVAFHFRSNLETAEQVNGIRDILLWDILNFSYLGRSYKIQVDVYLFFPLKQWGKVLNRAAWPSVLVARSCTKIFPSALWDRVEPFKCVRFGATLTRIKTRRKEWKLTVIWWNGGVEGSGDGVFRIH